MNFDNLKKWVQESEKDANGATILHSCAISNSNELASLIIQQQPNLIESVDNYGRTPLFWSFYSGACLTAITLMVNGGKINLQDFDLETPLHIAAKRGKFEETKTILFWLIKHDTEWKYFTQPIYQCLKLKNKQNLAPFELAKDKLKDDEMAALFKGIEEICESKLNSNNTIHIKEIIMKSGDFNGRLLSNLDKSIVSVKIEMLKDNLIMTCYKKLGDHMKVTMNLKKCAFIILEKIENKIELTLNNSPNVEIYSTEKKQWFEAKNSIFTIGQSFHCLPLKPEDLLLLNKFLMESNILTQFQEFCFSYKPIGLNIENSVNSNTNNTTNLLATSPSKMNYLRHKFGSLTISKNTNSPTGLQPNEIKKDNKL